MSMFLKEIFLLDNTRRKDYLKIMQKKYGEQKEIGKWLKIKDCTLSNILRGERRPSPRQAKRLERISGITRLDWLYAGKQKLNDLVLRAYRNKETKVDPLL